MSPLHLARNGTMGASLVVLLALSSAALAEPQRVDPTTPSGAPSAGPPAESGSDSEADGEDPAVSRARGAFKLGASLAREGQWADALAAFERSAELLPHPVTTYNIGYVERALGRLTRAKVRLEAALRAESAPEDKRLPPDLALLARGYLTEIDQKLARVSISLDGPLAVAIDGRPLEVVSSAPGARPTLFAGTAPLGAPSRPPASNFDLLIDPGAHVIVLATEDGRETLQHRTFEQGTNGSLKLTVGAASETTRAKVAPQPSSSTSPSHSTWMWASYGAGAAGVVAGSIFGILAIRLNSDLEGACPDVHRCPRGDDITRLNVYTWGANVSWIVAGLGAGVGTYLLFTEKAEKTQVPASARIGVTPRGLVLRGEF